MLGTFIASFATGELMNGIQRLKKALVAYTLAGTFFLVGVIFLLVACTIWLSQRYGAVQATLAVGAAFIVIAVVVMIIYSLTSRTKARTAKRRRNDDLKKAAIATGIAVLPTLLRGRGGKALLLAPAVGALAYALYRENSSTSRTRRDIPEED